MGKLYYFEDGIDENMKEKIAEYFIAVANTTGELITNLKLQKLVYYAQAWHLAIYNQPLFREDFQAWVHGPVLPSLYNNYKRFRGSPIKREDLDEQFLNGLKLEFGDGLAGFMDEVTGEYFGISAYDLEQLTHSEEPWIKARRGCQIDEICMNNIEKSWIENYYKQRLVN